jgi:cytochrome c peroxidase
MKTTSFILALVLVLFYACKPDPPPDPTDIPYDPTPYIIEVPANLPEMPVYEENPTTVEGVKLGRMLYYDPDVISLDGLACASCHNQQNAFSAPSDGPTGTAILPHINLGWNHEFGWVGGEELLDHVALADLQDGNVFTNANNDSILARLARHPDYPRMFKEAFGVDILAVDQEHRHEYMAFALAQFMRTLVSANSRFDKFQRREADGTMTQSEYNGYVLFFSERGDCFHCHSMPLITSHSFHNNGLDSVFDETNEGRFAVTGDPADIGKFRAPTLRNIEFTAPYMHDGRFQTLEEVVEHYNSGVKNSPTVDPVMGKPGKEFGLNLTPQEKQDLVNFLKTLTDPSFINNPELGSPF